MNFRPLFGGTKFSAKTLYNGEAHTWTTTLNRYRSP